VQAVEGLHAPFNRANPGEHCEQVRKYMPLNEEEHREQPLPHWRQRPIYETSWFGHA
jgi:hypothetical protein